MRILVVDDEPLVLSTLGLIFRKNGFDIETSSTKEDALEALRANPPDLVLCDIEMPGSDGFSLMADLSRELPAVPVLVLTGSYASLARVYEFARNMPQSVSVMTKPCQPSELLRTAGHLLKIA